MKKLLLFSLFFFFLGINTCKATTSTATQYILMDETTGRVLAGKNYNTPMLIASITKIMTATLAIESNKLDEVVKVDDTILSSYGSGIYIEVDEELTLRDLLYGLMLRSGNDAALMIAKYVGGTVEEFVNLMNQKAKSIGMKNTTFVNPSGLDNDDGGNYSTAYDMALLTRYAMQYEDYQQIVSTEKYKLKTNKKTYIWHNKNKLLKYDYITGGKTGYTEKAKRTLVSTASKNNIDLIAVTIKDSDDWNTHLNLYEYAYEFYTSYKILNKNTYTVLKDNYYNNNLMIKNDLYIPLKKDETKKLVSYIKLEKKKTYKEGDLVGINEIYLDDELIYTENIYVTQKNIQRKKSILEKIKELFK